MPHIVIEGGNYPVNLNSIIADKNKKATEERKAPVTQMNWGKELRVEGRLRQEPLENAAI